MILRNTSQTGSRVKKCFFIAKYWQNKCTVGTLLPIKEIIRLWVFYVLLLSDFWDATRQAAVGTCKKAELDEGSYRKLAGAVVFRTTFL